jgi:putative nucleotidyltransferase with HDIG domain
MFIEELEVSASRVAPIVGGFLISSQADVRRVAQSHALSAVIDTTRGTDIQADVLPEDMIGSVAFDGYIKSEFTPEQIGQARKAIAETQPYIRTVLSQARLHRVFRVDAANQVVEQVMSEALTNAGALVGVARLKDKDESTFLHSLAVSALMITFARSLGLEEQTVRLLGLGGLVHDIGKMVLPIELLQKPGSLTDDELAIIRTHPERGHEMISQNSGLPKAILDICLYHHEKFDGSGYPQKLSGSTIPSVARIAAICDVYDALTTIRPYKRAWTQSEAIDAMLRTKGHFDPELLKAFISNMIIDDVIR